MTVAQQMKPARTKVSSRFKVIIIGPVVPESDNSKVLVELSTRFVIEVDDCGSPQGMQNFINALSGANVLGRLSNAPFNGNGELSRSFPTVESYKEACSSMAAFSKLIHGD